MKIAISATGNSLGSGVDPRFGRCSTLLVVETNDLSFEALDNRNSSLGGGAGIQTAQLLAHQGVKAVLTGSCGPNAYQALSAAGVEVYVGCSGTVSEVVARFTAGQLQSAATPNGSRPAGTGQHP